MPSQHDDCPPDTGGESWKRCYPLILEGWLLLASLGVVERMVEQVRQSNQLSYSEYCWTSETNWYLEVLSPVDAAIDKLAAQTSF